MSVSGRVANNCQKTTHGGMMVNSDSRGIGQNVWRGEKVSNINNKSNYNSTIGVTPLESRGLNPLLLLEERQATQ